MTQGAAGNADVEALEGDIADEAMGPVVEAPAAVDIVSRIQRVEADLSPAERRVAEAVKADFDGATRITIADLARKAGGRLSPKTAAAAPNSARISTHSSIDPSWFPQTPLIL